MKAMILAAGLGTRLRPVTEKYAKPAVPFLNIPLLYFSIPLLEEAGVDSLVLNTHYLPDQIERLTKNIPGSRAPVALSHEVGIPLGSGGGIWKARKHIEGGGDFLVCNGDEVILPKREGTMKAFVRKHKEARALATILVTHHPLVGTQFGGVWADANGDIKGFGKDRSKFPGTTGYHYIGLLLLNDRIFEYLPEGESNILYDALAAAIAKGEKVQVLSENFTWFETGNAKDFLHATGEAIELLEKGSGEDAKKLKEICARFWKPNSKLENSVLTNEARKERFTAKGFAVIGENCLIESGSVLENCVLLPGAQASASRPVKDEIVI